MFLNICKSLLGESTIAEIILPTFTGGKIGLHYHGG